MSSIRIIAIPPGEAPRWVRQAWVGMVLQVDEVTAGGNQVGVLGGPAQNGDGFSVYATAAFDELYKKDQRALAWWQHNCPHLFRDFARLIFTKSACEVIENDPYDGGGID